ncbi:hypothetical protein [Nocardia terpenica]|uniref:Uncharacterized protein n=1 Tax=Nocardia terpenica TaxID=455432 RepID=A0A161XFN7_9NOCA|nr:hypothetical protein [Nocardia terpenica]KZM72238.1 hypothetical protein AWN90_36805 [Nocardia terpenica]NQE86616.1 hypothetical protein [Nocardia terpenica]
MTYTVEMWGAYGGHLESGLKGSERMCGQLVEQVMNDLLRDGWAMEVITSDILGGLATAFTMRHPVTGQEIGGLRTVAVAR